MKKIFIIIILLVNYNCAQSQVIDTLLKEDFDKTNVNTLINNYPFDFSVEGDIEIRQTRQSDSYNNASAGGNIYFNNDYSYFTIKDINISQMESINISFGLLKFGNALDGSNFEIAIIIHNNNNDTIIYKPSLITGLNTSNWRQISLPTIVTNNGVKMDIKFQTLAYQNPQHEYRIDDIIVTGQRNNPLNIVLKSFNIIDDLIDYHIEGNIVDTLIVENSSDAKLFEIINNHTNPPSKGKIRINNNNGEYFRIKIYYEGKEYISKVIKRKLIGNKYIIENNKIVFNNTIDTMSIYNINGKIIKVLYNTNTVELNQLPKEILIINNGEKIFKIKNY